MIDYDKTIDKFFDGVVQYLNSRVSRAKDTQELAKIRESIKSFELARKNPREYCDVYKKYQELKVNGLLRGQNNSVYIAVRDVLAAMDTYYKHEQYGYNDDVKKALLEAIKKFNYTASSSVLKDFTFAFMSPSRFAVRVKPGNEK
ncbi:MAG: hypothetical protein IJ560_01485 [Alphaproteobacteria bacterium]|nr:hypothetical protein [Alphaproteobacteria bacterium]